MIELGFPSTFQNLDMITSANVIKLGHKELYALYSKLVAESRGFGNNRAMNVKAGLVKRALNAKKPGYIHYRKLLLDIRIEEKYGSPQTVEWAKALAKDHATRYNLSEETDV